MQTPDREISAPQQVGRCHDASLMHQPPRHWPYGFLGICRSGEHPPGVSYGIRTVPSKVNGRRQMGMKTWEELPVGHWRHGAIIGVGGGGGG
jgi:hypothetical protein